MQHLTPFRPRLRTAALVAAALLAGHGWAQTTAAQQGGRNPNNPPPNSAPTPTPNSAPTPGTAPTANTQPSKPLPTANAQQSQAKPLPTANAQQSSPNPSTPPNPPGTQPPPNTGQPTPSAMPDLYVRGSLAAGAVEGLPGTGACKAAPPSGGPSRQLTLMLGNMGTVAAGAHTATVIFQNASAAQREVKLQRASAAANGTTIWNVDIPASAWANTEARFTATIDSGNTVVEGYEGNNVFNSRCLRPAG